MEIFKNGKHVILSFQQKDTCNSSENTNEWKKNCDPGKGKKFC